MRKRAILLLPLIVIAVGVKSSYLVERISEPDLIYPRLDAKYHHEWAIGLATGQWTDDLIRVKDEAYFRAPLYAYFASLVYRVVGPDPRWVLIAQLLIGCMSAMLLFLFTARVFGQGTARVTLILYLLYWPITYFEMELLIPALLLVLDLALLVLLVRAVRAPQSSLNWALAGVVLGLSALARPNILIVVPFVVAWIVHGEDGSRRKRIRPIGILLSAAALTILPVTVRNLVVAKDPVLISSQGGVNFYIGNNARSDGVKAVVPGTPGDWWGGFWAARRMAETASNRSLKQSEVSRYWYREGLTFLAGEPRKAIRLWAR